MCADQVLHWAGENRSLQEEIIDFPAIKCKFEFIAPDLLQQNGKIERKFATLYGKVCAI
jgi:hypothetical protein